jgi:hypothetical protein
MNRCAQGIVALALALTPLVCFGDSSYKETTQLTGGQLVDSLQHIPFMGKQFKNLTAPATTTTIVHGNQKAVVTDQSTEIYDLDKQEVIHIDTVNKQYSIDTFDDMRKAMAKAPDMMKQAQAQAPAQAPQTPPPPSNLKYSFSVSVTDTGVQQVMSGLNAKQQIVKLTTVVTDTTKPGTTATYTTTSEIWTTPDEPQEMKDSQDFDARFEKALMSGVDLTPYLKMLAGAPHPATTQVFASQPGAAGAYDQMGKEMEKIQGTQILVKTTMSGSGTGAGQPQGGSGGSQPTDTASGDSPLAQGITALGGLFGKKKAQPASTAPTGSATNTPPGETTLLETTTQLSGFSHDTVPASVFEIPAGFKQVPSRLQQVLANQ